MRNTVVVRTVSLTIIKQRTRPCCDNRRIFPRLSEVNATRLRHVVRSEAQTHCVNSNRVDIDVKLLNSSHVNIILYTSPFSPLRIKCYFPDKLNAMARRGD